MPSQPRAFNAVFDRAQVVLRQTFGMELVELRGKNTGDMANGTNGESQHPVQTQKKGKGRAREDDGEEDEDDAEEEEAEAGPGRRKSKGGYLFSCPLETF